MRKLKVWGGWVHNNRGQVRHIVAAPSQKRVVELMRERGFRTFTIGYVRMYWGETRNERELQTANHEGVWESNKTARYSGSNEHYKEVTLLKQSAQTEKGEPND